MVVCARNHFPIPTFPLFNFLTFQPFAYVSVEDYQKTLFFDMDFIIHLLINAAIIFVVAYIMPQIHIRSYGLAIVVAIVIGLLNATIGFLLRLPLNVVTLGLLSFFVRLFVSAIIIKLVDKLFKGFEIRGFWPALVLALVIALAGSFLDQMFVNG
jgi:putative membrane protein